MTPGSASARRYGVALIVGFFACSVLLTGMSSQVWAGEKPLSKGKPPLELDWTSLDGESSYGWGELQEGDSPLVMVFWASWCSVCKKDWPKLQELEAEFADAALAPRWVGVAVGDKAAKAAAEVAKRNLPPLQLRDPDEENFKALGLKYVPFVCVLDGEGNVAYAAAPKIKKLRKLLAELCTPPDAQENSK